jgi:predicted TIM-barrel fold metal-dependent hydrolase
MASPSRDPSRALLALLLCAGCARGAAAVPEARSRNQIVPLVEHHQHLVGPMLITPPPASLPAIELPAELAAVVREREKISGTSAPSEVYSEDALVLDVSEAEDHWVRGRAAAQRMAAAYTPDTHFIPVAYWVEGQVATIAGVVRTGDSTLDEMHFIFGLKKDGQGVWRIAVEYATNKPPLMFAEPIAAEQLIANLDDAGIQRAVVLSTAYWVGSPFNEQPIDDEAGKVRAANDWIVEQVARYPERLIAFCGVNPLKDYALDELARCAELPRVKGMKLHFGNSQIDVKNPAHVEQLKRFFRAANQQQMAIVVHLWTLDRSYGAEHSRIFLEQILPEAPDVTVQIAHMGGGGRYVHDDVLAVFADAITAGDPRMKHVYFDLATVVDGTLSEETIELLARRLRQIGLERILFGSDTTVGTRPPPILAWATIRRRLPLSDAELGVIAGNVARYLR